MILFSIFILAHIVLGTAFRITGAVMVEPYSYHGKAIRGGRRDIMAKQFVVRTDPTTMSVTKVVAEKYSPEMGFCYSGTGASVQP